MFPLFQSRVQFEPCVKTGVFRVQACKKREVSLMIRRVGKAAQIALYTGGALHELYRGAWEGGGGRKKAREEIEIKSKDRERKKEKERSKRHRDRDRDGNT
jgi:hypothetical protein